MPWRLIEFVVIFGLFVVFIAFNLGNTCDINFGFKTLVDVPVFLTAFSAFFFGMLCTVPFVIGARARRKTGKTDASSKPKKGKKEKDAPQAENAIASENTFSDGGPYGVN